MEVEGHACAGGSEGCGRGLWGEDEEGFCVAGGGVGREGEGFKEGVVCCEDGVGGFFVGG